MVNVKIGKTSTLTHMDSGSDFADFVVCLSSVCSSVTIVHPTQATEILGNVSTLFGTLAICDLLVKILQRLSQGNPSIGGVKHKRGVEYSDFGPIERYISETVQDRR